MPHIQLLNDQLPGIVGLLDYRRETAQPLSALAEILLRGDSTLSSGEREMIASYVSFKNECHFCHSSHGAAAAAHLNKDANFLDDIKLGFVKTPVSAKLRALLNIAAHVQQGGKKVTEADVAAARKEGATDREIHDTVLIAAAFCMYNRYVDGLGTWAPPGNDAYMPMGERLAKEGYMGY
ncbi:carboxymuconolactone decarboxylase family protein [Chryseolinea soli]|uniref:Carboxymuconolactone decarboxylase n=1 Tax=Chryseolinea soli TaxID=2321403 RepID=A0A385T0L3_9BACT|nr:peroxidase-related enzyme [Chryseolinea soli]AYB34608.1 carboxymuconolactone decarboxylase [Chryseolinea soli]